MSTRDEWYRSADWSQEDQTLFHRKIKASTSVSSRAQYVYIKARLLIRSKDTNKINSAITLLSQLVDDQADQRDFILAKVTAELGYAHEQLGDYQSAMQWYEDSIAVTGSVASVFYYYPLMIINNDMTALYDTAQNVVNIFLKENKKLVFELDKLIYYSVHAVALDTGHSRDDAAKAASEALKTFGVSKSAFPFHDTIGLVPASIYGQLRSKLLRIKSKS